MTLLEPLPATIAGLTPDEDDAFRRLTAKIIRHRTRNRIRTVYYNGRNELHDLGYSLPPIAKDVEIVVGWPEKAIEGLANRVVLDGITTQDGSDLSKQVNDLLDANDLAQTAENAHTDALVHSCSFVAALQGTPDGRARRDHPGVPRRRRHRHMGQPHPRPHRSPALRRRRGRDLRPADPRMLPHAARQTHRLRDAGLAVERVRAHRMAWPTAPSNCSHTGRTANDRSADRASAEPS